jgi:hypothetical protein
MQRATCRRQNRDMPFGGLAWIMSLSETGGELLSSPNADNASENQVECYNTKRIWLESSIPKL